MCLIFVAWQAHPRYRLVVAANRDEFHARPTAPAAPWAGADRGPGRPAGASEAAPPVRGGNGEADRHGGRPDPPGRACVLAGRDLEAGGTWLGVTADGRFAALTNFRAAAPPRPDAPSRGRLVANYLRSGRGAREEARRLAHEAGRYSGFNLLLADRDALSCVANRGKETVAAVPPGCHGLSNDRLNVPWPKVRDGLAEFRRRMHCGPEPDDLFALLADDAAAAGADLPAAGRPEPAHSARFVRGEAYGTRSSTVVRIDRAGAIDFEERSFDSSGAETGRAAFVSAAGGRAGFDPVAAAALPDRAPPALRSPRGRAPSAGYGP